MLLTALAIYNSGPAIPSIYPENFPPMAPGLQNSKTTQLFATTTNTVKEAYV